MDLTYRHDLISQLQLQCQRLDAQLKAEIESRASAEKKLAAANRIIVDMTVASAKQQEEIADLKADMDAKDGYTLDLRKRHKALQANYENAIQKSNTLEAEVKSYEDDANDKWVIATLNKETVLRLGLEKEVKQLNDEIKQLKEERNQKEPLVKVGIDIRLRFLEQSKEFVCYSQRERLNKEIQELGNRAAHGGNGEADAALFILGLVSEPQIKPFITLFQELYHNNPAMFTSGPLQVREVINHKVTIRTLRALNSGLDRPLLERQRAMEHISIIMDKCAKLKDEKLVAKDADIARRVDLVREETAIIVELDRQSQSRGLSSKENRRPSKSERNSSAGFGLC